MRKLAVIHFSPIEWYPPAMNWLNFLAGKIGAGQLDADARVYTLGTPNKEPLFAPGSDRIRIIRPAKLHRDSAMARYSGYTAFYLQCLAGLFSWRPDTVLYYETLSSLPALIYKKMLPGKSRLFIHYHEYTSPREYQEGMKLAGWMHEKERRSYGRAAWISQTNEQRNEFFRKDLIGQTFGEDKVGPDGLPLRVLPNYPPKDWLSRAGVRKGSEGPLKMVYVGALSLETMYVREMAEWVIAQQGRVTWDVYTSNSTAAVRDYLRSLDDKLIRLREPVNYFCLPEVLKDYQIGVILYNGHIPNYIYNAPNKLFEYLALGLDVWFPRIMEGSLAYVTQGTYPRVVSLDFEAMEHVSPEILSDRTGLSYLTTRYNCEEVLSQLLNAMMKKD